MIKNIIGGLGSVLAGATRFTLGAGAASVAIALGGCITLYEGVCLAGNYVGEFIAKGRLAILEHTYKNEAKEAFTKAAQEREILSPQRQLTKYAECVQNLVADHYAHILVQSRTGRHVQYAILLKDQVAAFKTVIDLPPSNVLKKEFSTARFNQFRNSSIPDIETCESAEALQENAPATMVRLKILAENLSINMHPYDSPQYVVTPHFEFSNFQLMRDEYTRKLGPHLAAVNMPMYRLEKLVNYVAVYDGYRKPTQLAGQFYSAKQIREFKESPGYRQISEEEQAVVRTQLNMEANLP